MRATQDVFVALLFVGLLSSFGSVVKSSGIDRHAELDARLASLLAAYGHPPGGRLAPPTVVLADWDGPAVASSNCEEWRISVHAGAIAGLSSEGVDDLLAHELAHLLVCAETGHNAGHGEDWWRRYHALVDLT